MTSSPPIYSSLIGQLLIATPHMDDSQFQQAVIFICQHDNDSAMGLVINRPIDELTFGDLAHTLKLGTPRDASEQSLFSGGPVEAKRGYILHSQEQMMPETITISDDIALSLQMDVLRDIAQGIGPAQSKIMLGYAGWGAGQLEDEMRENMWFHIPASTDLVFSDTPETLWATCFKIAGLDAGSLSPQAGHA